MTAAGYGAIAGAGLAQVSNLLSLRSANKAAIGQIQREGHNLATSMRQININRQIIENDLGNVLSANALESVKNMATAKAIMSVSGTVGGTTAQVSKQEYMSQILADADAISQARNREAGLLTEQLSRRIQFRQSADATRSQIASPLQAVVGSISSMISGAAQGAMIGNSLGGIGSGGGAIDATAVVASQASQQATSNLHKTSGGWSAGSGSYNSYQFVSDPYLRPSFMPKYSPYEG